MKNCIACGAQNDDQSAFCTSCGHQFVDVASPAAQGPDEAVVQTAIQFTAERGPGARAHIISDTYLKDAVGKVVLVARKQGMMHENYAIRDGNETTTGYIETKRHLTSTTVQEEDAGHAVKSSTQISVQRRTTSIGPFQRSSMNAKCSIEDPSGVQVGSVSFQNGFMNFSLTKTDGSTIFEASLVSGSGMMDSLSALTHLNLAIALYDKDFPLTTLLTVIVAIDQAMGA